MLDLLYQIMVMFSLLLFTPLHNFISVISVKFLCKSYGGHATLRTTYPYGPGKCWEQFHCCTKRCNLINHQDTFLSSLTTAPELSKGPAQQKHKAARGISASLFLAEIPVSAKLEESVWGNNRYIKHSGKAQEKWQFNDVEKKIIRERFICLTVCLYALHWGRRVFSCILNLLLVRVNLCQ